jgi:PAS domain S-box-containing protein
MSKQPSEPSEQAWHWEEIKTVLETAAICIWSMDIQTNKITSSLHLEDILGLETDNFNYTYQEILNCIHQEDREFVQQSYQQAIENKKEFEIEFRVLLADDKIRWLLSQGVVTTNSLGTATTISGVYIDITARKRAEAELQRQNLQWKLFADISLKIRQSLQIDEILQTSVTEIQKLLQGDRVLILQIHDHSSFLVVKESVVTGLPIMMGENIIADSYFQEHEIQKYQQGKISAISNIETAPLQQNYIEYLQKFAVKANLVVPIFQKHQLWGLLVIHQCLYIRTWTNWEIELLQQLAVQIGITLAQSLILEQKTQQLQDLTISNEELQQFALIASHDLQEPLRKIKTFGERLQITCRDSLNEQGLDYLQRMLNATLRMQTLIQGLLALSRVTTKGQKFVTVNLNQIVQEVLSDLEITIQQTQVQVEVEELPVIQADPLQMRQLIQNLIINSIKFRRQNQPPVIKIYSQVLDNHLENPILNNDHHQIIVEDNGIGFSEQYLDRIFHIFQRLHNRHEYEGTGIGLAICRKIVERHRGYITAKSQPDQGAKFIITLPVTSHI